MSPFPYCLSGSEWKISLPGSYGHLGGRNHPLSLDRLDPWSTILPWVPMQPWPTMGRAWLWEGGCYAIWGARVDVAALAAAGQRKNQTPFSPKHKAQKMVSGVSPSRSDQPLRNVTFSLKQWLYTHYLRVSDILITHYLTFFFKVYSENTWIILCVGCESTGRR